MKSLVIIAAAVAAISCVAPAAISPAEAQTVVVKPGHDHGHAYHPRRKKVVLIERGRHHGWRNHRHWRGNAHGHRNHGHGGTVGISVR